MKRISVFVYALLALICLSGDRVMAQFGENNVYFFRNGDYLRFDVAADRVAEGYPLSILGSGNWSGWPASWADGPDAAVNWADGNVYFFRKSEYLTYNIFTDQVDAGPYPICGNSTGWQGWPDWGCNGIDAAVNLGTGKAYFFKGPMYWRVDITSGVVDQGLRTIWEGWRLPFSFSGVDAAVNWRNGKVYFFKGNQYVRYDIPSDQVDLGPRYILGNWNYWPWWWNFTRASVRWGIGP